MNAGIISDGVMFFDDNKVVKEMLYPEFEAILDHVVAIDDFKGQTIRAVYVRINSRLKITAAVFFLIDFDASGYVDKSWNVPLQHLAYTAGRGPDLGAGPIKLSCRSQCSVSWHQRLLWDPVMDADNNSLQQLAKAAKRNRLGLTIDDTVAETALVAQPIPNQELSTSAAIVLEQALKEQLEKQFQQDIKDRIAILQDEQKLRIATMKSEAQDHLEKLQTHYRSELEKLAQTLESTKQLFSEEKQKNLQLKRGLDAQLQEFQHAREGLQQEIEKGKGVDQSQLQELEEKFQLETKARIEAATSELKEMLNMREVELYYRDEQISRLNDDVSRLRQEKQSLLDGSGERVLQKLVDSGITFVAYQPGVEPLTVPLHDMSKYLDSPIQYAAEKCSVDLDLYQSWRKHYDLPVCSHVLDNGSICAEPIAKVEKISRFIAGESDRCSKHSRSANTLSKLMKVRVPS
jgi:hypothetical protein